jgi:uncharacterized RDD family membrane protein YckC
MSSDDTHYELLGVDADAPKDDIRAAYQDKLANVRAARTKEEGTKRPSEEVLRTARDEEARLRSAWQVLSDPIQRGRYDERAGVNGGSTAEVDEDDDEDQPESDDGVDAPEPTRTTITGKPRQRREPPPPPPMAEGLEIPSTGRRVTAAVVDVVTMAALWALIFYPVTFGAGLTKGLPYLITEVASMEFVFLVYLIIPIYLGGQTLGKRYTYTMVVDRATGELPTMGAIIRRYIIPAAAWALLFVSGALLALIYATSFLLNRDQISLADRFAKTAVVIARYKPVRPV